MNDWCKQREGNDAFSFVLTFVLMQCFEVFSLPNVKFFPWRYFCVHMKWKNQTRLVERKCWKGGDNIGNFYLQTKMKNKKKEISNQPFVSSIGNKAKWKVSEPHNSEVHMQRSICLKKKNKEVFRNLRLHKSKFFLILNFYSLTHSPTKNLIRRSKIQTQHW